MDSPVQIDINPPLVVEYMPTPPKGILQNILGGALISGDAPKEVY